jgi:hypothetical protein
VSTYGVFESALTDDHDEQVEAQRREHALQAAIFDAREQFGSFLSAAADKSDFKDRVALVKNDMMKVVSHSLMPVPGVMRKVEGALKPDFTKEDGQSKTSSSDSPSTMSDADVDFEYQIIRRQTDRGDSSNYDRGLELRRELKSRGLPTSLKNPTVMRNEYGDKFDQHNHQSSRKEAFQSGDYVTYNGEEVQIDEINDNGVVIRFLDGNDTTTVDPSEITASVKKTADDYDIYDTLTEMFSRAGWSASTSARAEDGMDWQTTGLGGKEYEFNGYQGVLYVDGIEVMEWVGTDDGDVEDAASAAIDMAAEGRSTVGSKKESVWIDGYGDQEGYELTAEGVWEDFKAWAGSQGDTPHWGNFDAFLDQYEAGDFVDESMTDALSQKIDGDETAAPWRGLGKKTAEYESGDEFDGDENPVYADPVELEDWIDEDEAE